MKLLLLFFTIFFSQLVISQSIAHPDVYINQKRYLNKVVDEEYEFHFQDSRFTSFNSIDSSLLFDFDSRKILFFDSNKDSMCIEFNEVQKSINDSVVYFPDGNSFLDTTEFVWGEYHIKLEITKFLKRYKYVIWITRSNKELHFVESFHKDGVEHIYRTDYHQEIGYVFSTTFKRDKFIWKITPLFVTSKYDESANTVLVYNKMTFFEFDYAFSSRGKFKHKRSKGKVIYE